MGFFKQPKMRQLFTPAPAKAAQPPEKTAEEITAEEEQKKKAALVAANARGIGPSALGVAGPADVTRKTLLGL